MSKEVSRKYLDIPGEKSLIYTFKFNMDLPPPVPQPKTMFIPLDPERYVKPKITLLHVKRKPTLMTDINLSIPVDEINMRPELYNPPPDAEYELSEKDKELLEERPRKEKKKKASPPKTKQNNANAAAVPRKDSGSRSNLPQGRQRSDTSTNQKKPETAAPPKKKEEPKNLSIDEYVKQSFDVVKSFTVGGTHSSKEGLQCAEVFEILPDLSNLLTDIYAVKAEVSIDTLKANESILKFDADIDKKPVLGLYLNKPLFEAKKVEEKGMDEEKKDQEVDEQNLDLMNDPMLKKVENFEHVGNYIYSQSKHSDVTKKDLLLNLNKDDAKAYIYHLQSLALKKKKVLFLNKQLDGSDEENKKAKEDKKSTKTIKLVKRNLDKDELLLKKRRYADLQLEKTDLYQKTKQDINDYAEDDDLEEIKKKLIKEEEKVEDEEEADEEESPMKAEDEDEEVMKEEDNGEIKDITSNKDMDEEEEQYNGEFVKKEHAVDNSKNIKSEEAQYGEVQEVEDVKQEQEQEQAKDDESAKEDAQEIADFFGSSSEDDD